MKKPKMKYKPPFRCVIAGERDDMANIYDANESVVTLRDYTEDSELICYALNKTYPVKKRRKK